MGISPRYTAMGDSVANRLKSVLARQFYNPLNKYDRQLNEKLERLVDSRLRRLLWGQTLNFTWTKMSSVLRRMFRRNWAPGK